MIDEKTEAVPSRVRFAERADFDQIMFLCREWHAENGLFDISESRMASMVMSHFMATGGMIGVIGVPGALEAMTVLRLGSAWYSERIVLHCPCSYVLPEFRKSNNAKELIEFGRAHAQTVGVPLFIELACNEQTQGKLELYKRRMGEPAGAYFLANA